MIHIKTEKEITIMKQGGKILADALFATLEQVTPGVTELELDTFAENFIRSKGAEPGFQKVPGYKHTICASTNDVVVHGIPGKRVLKEGDIIGIDMGVFLGGFHTDMAETIRVESEAVKKMGEKDATDTFLAIGKRAMEAGIAQACGGNHVGHISRAMQDIIEKEGKYAVVRSLVGHGVGRALHEEPEIPGYLSKAIEKTPLLKPGMTIAIEIIYNQGKREVRYANHDEWTISSADGSLAGLFERSLVVTKGKPVILTAV
ncbi:type I methionyl aminopeptidase [soil metagenome]